MFNNDHNSLVSRRVNRVLFRSVNFNEVSEFATQGFRPYNVNHDTESVVQNALNVISERNFNMGRFSPSSVGAISDNMISLSGSSMGNIAIVNGWNNRRYMFSITVEVQMSSGGSICYIVTGFTDTNNVNVNGNHISIDPSIVLHITNIAETQVSHNQDGTTGLFVNKSDQVLTRQHYMNDLSVQGNEFRSQRPMDIFNTMTSNMFKEEGSNTTYINTETSLGVPVFGNRFNNIPNQYSANIFNSYVDAADTNSAYVGEHYAPQVAELVAAPSAKETYVSQNKFLEYLNMNEQSFNTRTAFTWRDILEIDPNIMDRFHLNRIGDRESFLPSSGLITANTNNRSDLMGQIASVLATSIPALANQCNLTTVSFLANNNFGTHYVSVADCTSFNPATFKAHSSKFEQLLPSQVLDSLFTAMQLSYEMTVYCQVNSETFIKLRVNGGPIEDFLIPTFAESLYTPIVTNNPNTISSISDTVKNLTTRISEESTRHSSVAEAQRIRQSLREPASPITSPAIGYEPAKTVGIVHDYSNNYTAGSSGF